MASLLSTASRLNTANQLTNWNTSCIQAMSQVKSLYTSIATQRTAMVDNADYTPEDIAEVDAMLVELNAMAVSLTAPTPVPVVEVVPEIVPETITN